MDPITRRVYEYQLNLLCQYMLKVYMSPLYLYETASEHSRTLYQTLLCSHLYIKFIDTVPELILCLDPHIPCTYAISENCNEVLNSPLIVTLVAQ